jgi:hypothetical protein
VRRLIVSLQERPGRPLMGGLLDVWSVNNLTPCPQRRTSVFALGLEYMALAARLGEPAAMRQDPAGFRD